MSTPDNGYIKLYRDLLNNPISQKPNYLAIWVYILLNANHRDNYTIINGEKTLIESGSFIGSLQKISKYFGISVRTVKNIVDYFDRVKMLHTERTHKFTIFKVLQWDKFKVVNTEETLGKHWVNTELPFITDDTLNGTLNCTLSEQSKLNEMNGLSIIEKKKVNTKVNTVVNTGMIFPISPLYKKSSQKTKLLKAFKSFKSFKSFKKKKIPKKKNPLFVEFFPEEFLSSESFVVAWTDWIAYRSQKRNPVTEIGAKRQARLLCSLSVGDAIQVIETSIMNSWTGLFLPKGRAMIPLKETKKQSDLWGKLRSEIKKQGSITDDEIVEWFENADVTIEFDWLIVGVDSLYRMKHIQENYADRLLCAGKKIFQVESIDIVLTGGLAEAAVAK